VEYGPESALIVVDVQNDFADPNGSLYVLGAEEAIDFINAEIEAAVAANANVIYTQDWHPASTPHFAKDGGVWPVHCVAATWGAAFHPGLEVVGPSIRKGGGGEDGYSGFTVRDPVSGQEWPTGLADLLTERGVAQVVIVGLATDYCVKATAIDAVSAGYETVALADGIRPVDLAPGDGDKAVAAMIESGVSVR
jgi:nicotinamidase/pyrazinamidase